MANYDQPESWQRALAGASKLLLISSSEVGRRGRSSAWSSTRPGKRAWAWSLTSVSCTRIARCSPSLPSTKATEQLLRESGLPFTLLRNGWYLENYTEQLGNVLQHGAFLGSAGQGRIAAAARSDFTAAAVKVLTGEAHSGAIYELAGDTSLTMDELAQEVSRQVGRTIANRDLPSPEYQRALLHAGLPDGLASALADSDTGVARGELDDRSQQLRALLGRPSTTLRTAVTTALASLER